MKCSLCNYEFNEEEAASACEGCGLFKNCDLVACPNCGFESPRESAKSGFLDSISSLFTNKEEKNELPNKNKEPVE